MGLDIFFSKNKTIKTFRKVNFLVKYFESKGFNVETQSPIIVHRDDVIELIDKCEQILKDHTKADKLLPTMSGFFFGSTDYDEYYYDDVKEVLDYCNNELLPEFNTLEENEYITFETWY